MIDLGKIGLTQKEQAALSLGKMIRTMGEGRLRANGSLEGEVAAALAAQRGIPFDPQRVDIAWSLLQRDLTAASSSGGMTIGTKQGLPIDVQRAYPIVERAGVQRIDGLTDNLSIPKTTAPTTAYWLADESTAITESLSTTGQMTLTPHACAVRIDFTHLFRRQAQHFDFFVQRELINTVNETIDKAVLSGTGASGQPQGIATATGVTGVSGTSLAWTGIAAMEAAASAAHTSPTAFIGSSGVRQTLRARERASGSGFVWDGTQIAGYDALATTGCPSGTLICGDFASLILATWGPGPRIEINPADFARGIYYARVILHVDVGITNPAAFSVATSVT